MEPSFQTSFLPKQRLAQELGTPTRRRGVYFGGIGPLIASTIFFLTLIGAGVLYALEAQATKRLDEALETLRKNQAPFELDTLDDLVRLHDRYQTALTLINAHIAPSLIFEPIAANTLPTVQYKSLSFTYGKDTVSLQMEALARDFASVALQTDAFVPQVGGPSLFFNPLVSNVKEEDDGKVSFTLTVQMPTQAVAYAERASREGEDFLDDLGDSDVSSTSSNEEAAFTNNASSIDIFDDGSSSINSGGTSVGIDSQGGVENNTQNDLSDLEELFR
ncbi:MAG: hypothetical protein KatS3mg099_418 [Candidatus Parcubacteria bacterium]|nr:MAG: hypothetical protein KatS3mg099_418 [Candidatus Parcubacteria bacterium]